MSNNRLPLLLGLLVVLLGVAWLAGVFESDPSTLDAPEVNIASGDVEAFAIVGPDLDVRLAKPAGVWQLMAPVAAKADSITVTRMLDDLSELRINAYVSGNPDRYGEFGVDSAASRVEIDGYTLFISERGPDFGSSYIRVSGDERVFSTGSRVSIPRTMDRWRDKQMVDFGGRSVAMAAATGPEESWELDATSGMWLLSANGGAAVPADSASVDRWLNRFSPLDGDGFYTDLTPDSLQVEGAWQLSFTFADGSTTGLRLAERPDGFGAHLGGTNDVFKLFASRKALLVPTSSELSAN